MIRKHIVIKRAVCDACGKPLSSEGQKNPDGTAHAVHYGVLKSDFGYGSPYDGEVEHEVCEACWKKALDALRLPINANIHTTPVYCQQEPFRLKDGKPFKGERGVEIYHTPVWRCYFCNFVSKGHGSMPEHACKKWKGLMAKCKKACPTCRRGNAGWPFPAWRAHSRRWSHLLGGPVPCNAHDILMAAMRADFE